MYDLSLKECFFKVQEVRGDRKIVVIHYFRLPTLQDWLQYYRGYRQIGLSKGRDTVEMSNVQQEIDEGLWNSLIERVEGYKYKGIALMENENWKDMIPLPHKLEAISGFLNFWREDVPDEGSMVVEDTLDLAESVIQMRFTALQNSDMKTLTYHFKSPDSKDYIRFSRISSRMQLVRTRQRNVSAIQVPSDIRPLVELFDKLIEKVEGYFYKEKDVMESSKWRDKLDANHKRATIQALFTSSLAETEQIEGKAIRD